MISYLGRVDWSPQAWPEPFYSTQTHPTNIVKMSGTWWLTRNIAIWGHVEPIWNVKNKKAFFLKLSVNDLLLA